MDRKCEKCGALLAADAPEGLCPRCLMGLNLATQTEAPEGEIGPDGTQVVRPKPEPPPPLEEIAPHFPHLEILECMGRGGMGVVYKARQPRLNRLVALKILAREKEKDQRFADRFTREAQALARLNHPNIVTVYDFGEADGLYYLLMEYVDGMNLRQLLQTRKLAPEEALTIVPSICEALQYAHQEGIVHRDIKPENILMDKQGRVKIADFGIAKLLGGGGAAVSLTGEQQVVGTPHYMAPEQVETPAVVDHRADIYSLGVVFYEMLTGELPLGKFAPPSQKVHVDVRLDQVVLHALEKEPERRYQQASQVKTDVETIAKSEVRGSQPVPPRSSAAMPAPAASGVGDALRQVRGPAIGLVITAILNWAGIPLIFLITMFVASRHAISKAPMLLLPLLALVLSGIMLVAGLKMKRLQAYWLAVAGSILAILVTPGNLIGLPIGIWALVVLSQRHVREAFRQGQGATGLQATPASNGGGGWKTAAVIAATVLLVLAIPVGAIILSIGLPVYFRAQHRANVTRAQLPTLVVHGTVVDAVTGRPIAGARVDDNFDGARPNRPPQQAWTDNMGNYKLCTWREAHTLAASAPGYETKLQVFTANGSPPRPGTHMDYMDFRLQPAKDSGPDEPGGAATAEESGAAGKAAPGTDPQVLEKTVRLGKEAYQSGDYSRALGQLLPAAMNGHPVAQHRVGVMYFMGQGVAQDAAEATRWFRKAAEQGQAESQYSLGMRYLLGESVVKDPKEAAHWFQLAAEQGVPEAQASLALRCANGDGVPQDVVEAYKWAMLARSVLGASSGSISLGNLEQRMTQEQIVEAKRRAKEFVPKRTGPADP